MAIVSHILDTKNGAHLQTITPEKSTYEALQMMAKYDIGAILVMDGETLVGVLTEREYARRIVLEGKTSRHTPVKDTMNKNFSAVSHDTTLERCMTLMTDKRTRYLPVLKNDKLAGLISIGDVVKNLMAEQRANIDHLEHYITGG